MLGGFRPRIGEGVLCWVVLDLGVGEGVLCWVVLDLE